MHELPNETQTNPDLDENERPTLPQLVVPTPEAITLPGVSLVRSFDAEAERFFAGGEESEETEEDLAAWWIAQRRKALTGWVTAVVVACVVLVAVGVLGS